MKLYHFTSKSHWNSIHADGFIDTTESNVSLFEVGKAPDVVWLTTCDTPELGHGLISILDKQAVRIEVELPNGWAKNWLKWAKAQGMDEKWMESLIKAGGGMEAAKTWFVCTRPIPRKYWTSIAVKEDAE